MAYVVYMRFRTSFVLCVLMNFVTSEQHYCEFDSCRNEQYCCGYNKCCNNHLDLWFLWLGVVVICFTLTIIAIIKCIRRQKSSVMVYNELPTDEC